QAGEQVLECNLLHKSAVGSCDNRIEDFLWYLAPEAVDDPRLRCHDELFCGGFSRTVGHAFRREKLDFRVGSRCNAGQTGRRTTALWMNEKLGLGMLLCGFLYRVLVNVLVHVTRPFPDIHFARAHPQLSHDMGGEVLIRKEIDSGARECIPHVSYNCRSI